MSRRDHLISFRVSPDELAAITTAACADGRTIANYVRYVVLTHLPPASYIIPDPFLEVTKHETP